MKPSNIVGITDLNLIFFFFRYALVVIGFQCGREILKAVTDPGVDRGLHLCRPGVSCPWHSLPGLTIRILVIIVRVARSVDPGLFVFWNGPSCIASKH